MKRVLIVHGWGAGPNKHWFKWIEKELNDRGFEVILEQIPSNVLPELNLWKHRVRVMAEPLNEELIILAHSIGCSATLHMLQDAREGEKVWGVVCVSPLVLPRYGPLFPTMFEPLYGEKIAKHLKKMFVIFDPAEKWAPKENAEFLFRECKATLVACPGKNHFSDFDGVLKAPEVLRAVLELDAQR